MKPTSLSSSSNQLLLQLFFLTSQGLAECILVYDIPNQPVFAVVCVINGRLQTLTSVGFAIAFICFAWSIAFLASVGRT